MMENFTQSQIDTMRVLAATARCATTEEIMRTTGPTREIVEYHLEVLKEQGFISANKEGKHCSLDDVRKLQDMFRKCERCFDSKKGLK